MSFILQPWHIVLSALSQNFNDIGADDYLRGTGPNPLSTVHIHDTPRG